jgi:hypothetical protein
MTPTELFCSLIQVLDKLLLVINKELTNYLRGLNVFAAFSLLHKRKQLFSLGTNNALLEFLLEGTPTVREQLVDSRKEVDKQLKASCEAFIQHTTKSLAAPLLTFLDKVRFSVI